MSTLHYWLTPPVFADDEQTRLARLLHWILVFLAAATLFDAAILFVFAPETLPTFWINGVFLVVLGLSYWMLRTGRVRRGALLVGVTSWALLVGYLAVSGGVTSPATGLFAVIIIVSAVLLGVREALAFGFLCIASTAVLYWLGINGWITSAEPTPTPDRLFATQTATFLILTLLMSVSGRTVLDALSRARAGERTVVERNRQLQEEIARREQAQQAQARLVAIVEATPDFVAMSDLEGKLLHLNRGGRTIMGISEDTDVTQTRIADYHPAPVTERIFNEAIPTALREGAWSGETLLRTHDGRDLPASQVVISLRDGEGRVAFLATILRDISDRKQAEQQRLELAVLEERLAAFKDFLGMISHDLKTPMSVILTSLDLLERLEDPERRHAKLVGIRQQINLLQAYVQDLLLLTRMEHVPAISLEPVDVNKLLREVQNHVAPAAAEKGIALRVEPGALHSTILADEQAIYHTLTNLIENAVHYTLAGGSVTVTTHSDAADTIIEVADTGIGIDPAELEHVFDRFYRTHEARRLRPSGTGLGLAIVKRIVEAHAGKIEVESTPGAGTTFRIRLPQAPA